jgi:hypothetical protein
LKEKKENELRKKIASKLQKKLHTLMTPLNVQQKKIQLFSSMPMMSAAQT